MDTTPRLLAVDTVVWQRALAVMHLHGVAGSAAETLSNADMLCVDWLEPGRIASRLALQRCMGQSAAGVYTHFAGLVARTSARRLVGRLLYLEQHGLLHLLVADMQAAKRAWRRECGLPANKKAPDEPAFISLSSVASLPDDKFCSKAQPLCGTTDFATFKRGLPDLPAWQHLWAEAEAERGRVRALLPLEMRLGLIRLYDEQDNMPMSLLDE